LAADFLDKEGKRKPIIMGSYGIGVERVIACYIEQNHDENGIIWNKALTPYDLHLIELPNNKEPKVKEVSEKLYADLQSAGYDVLFDDRDERVGVKFNDADLIGLPFQVVVGAKNIVNNQVEVKNRRTCEKVLINIENLNEYLSENYK
jgi:prolyl-tRNA synthetase